MKLTCFDFANVVSFWISIFSIFSIAYYFLFQETYYLFLNVYVVVFQCSYDIFLWHSHSSALHHMFVLLFTSYFVTTEIPVEDCITLVLTILSTEISTLFLVIKIWLEQSEMQQTIFYTVNIALFLLSFLYTRIYLYTNFVILNPQTYNLNLPFVPYIGLYGLFALNIYWVTLMVKMIFKSLKLSDASYYTLEFLRFGQSVNYIIVYFWYNSAANIVATFAVALTSYVHHSTMQFINYESIFFNCLYHMSIQLESFLYVFYFLGNMFGHISVLYHFLFLSLTLFIAVDKHYWFSGKSLFYVFVGFYGFLYIICSIDNFYVNSLFYFLLTSSLLFYSYPFFCVTEKEMLLIPLILDTLAILYFITELQDKIAFGVINYVIVLVLYIKPLYSYNDVLLYLLSFARTFAMCRLK